MKHSPSDSPEDGTSAQADDATLRKFFGYQMKRSFNVVKSDLARVLKPFDLRMLTYTALVLIVDNPGLRQSQLAAAMDIERPNLVTIVDELEKRGLIRRDRVPNDRRAYALMATLSGRRLYDAAVAAVERHEAELLAGIGEEMRAAALEAMRWIERRKSDR